MVVGAILYLIVDYMLKEAENTPVIPRNKYYLGYGVIILHNGEMKQVDHSHGWDYIELVGGEIISSNEITKVIDNPVDIVNYRKSKKD